MKLINLIICLLAIITPTMSQNLKFDNSSWDFSTIAEEGGEVSHTFTFKNISSTPIVIINATTTCGCTIPKYSRKPISPGAESTIEITYDPLYRPGRFSREIKIHTSASDNPEVIKIVGNVTPRKKSIQEQYIYLLEGGVRISSLYAYLQSVSPLSPRSSTFEIINTSDKSHQIRIEPEFTSPYLSLYHPTQTLKAGEKGVITITYEIPQNKLFYGEITDYLSIYIDDVKSRQALQLRAYGVEDFDKLSKNGSARAEFSKKMITFEPLNISKDSIKKEFTIKNIGTAPLFIRGITLPQEVKITTSKEENPIGVEIAAGKSLDMYAIIKPATLGDEILGDFAKNIIFILNDPEEPVARVRVMSK